MNTIGKYARVLLATLSVLATGAACAQAEDERPSTLDELKAAIDKVLIESDVPAVSIAMVEASGPVWVGAIGKANVENNTDADEDTLFRIGSTSKMFVALSVLKLIEQGRLSLDDEVSQLAPEIAYENQWESTDPIRVVHLLEHTTGWDDIHLPEYAHNDPTPATLKQGLDFHPHSRVSRWKPGSRMSYCNAGPAVAAYVVEKLTGQAFEAYVAEHFFEPMGMQSMTYLLSDDVRSKGATLYANGTPRPYEHIIVRPSGSINASAYDMARLAMFFVNRGAIGGVPLVSQASLARMESVTSTSAAKVGQETGYGLHNYSFPHENWVYRAHDGGVSGGISEFAYLPEAGVGHAIMINSDDGATFGAITKLVRNYETRNLRAREVTASGPITGEHQSIEGLYHPINPRQQVSFFLDRIFGVQKLWFEGEKLFRRGLLGGEPTTYYPVSSDLYKSEKTGFVSLSRAVDPLAGPVVHANNTVLKPVAVWLVWFQLGVAALWVIAIVSSLLYALVWGVRKLRGKVPAGATMYIRLWPLLAGLAMIGFMLLFTRGMSDPFALLGAPTVISVGIMLATIAFALFAILGVYTCVVARDTPMHRGNYWYSSITSGIHLLVAGYLLAFGIIGLMTWA